MNGIDIATNKYLSYLLCINDNRLPVVNLLPIVNPQSGQFGEDIDHLEGLEVVNEDVGNPEVVDQLQVHWK